MFALKIRKLAQVVAATATVATAVVATAPAAQASGTVVVEPQAACYSAYGRPGVYEFDLILPHVLPKAGLLAENVAFTPVIAWYENGAWQYRRGDVSSQQALSGGLPWTGWTTVLERTILVAQRFVFWVGYDLRWQDDGYADHGIKWLGTSACGL